LLVIIIIIIISRQSHTHTINTTTYNTITCYAQLIIVFVVAACMRLIYCRLNAIMLQLVVVVVVAAVFVTISEESTNCGFKEGGENT
jgi:ABC-type bacteriocin/lantibiotic exporter with double-glycine peptidase domain